MDISVEPVSFWFTFPKAKRQR